MKNGKDSSSFWGPEVHGFRSVELWVEILRVNSAAPEKVFLGIFLSSLDIHPHLDLVIDNAAKADQNLYLMRGCYCLVLFYIFDKAILLSFYFFASCFFALRC